MEFELDTVRPLKSRFVECKLVLLALMWIQYSEDQQKNMTDDYSTPLLVDNSTWSNEFGFEIEHFRKVSNTVRIGVWEDVIRLSLKELLIPAFPTCLHAACYHALAAIAMHIIDEEIAGKYINPADQCFARRLVYQSLELLNKERYFGHREDSFYLTIDSTDEVCWGYALYYLTHEIVAYGDFFFVSDIDDNTGFWEYYNILDDVEKEEFEYENWFNKLETYTQCKPFITQLNDRQLLLSRLVTRVVYYLCVGHGYDDKNLDTILLIPFTSRASGSFQSTLAAATYRVGYFITSNNIEEWIEGKNWLLHDVFSSVLPFYERGKKEASILYK